MPSPYLCERFHPTRGCVSPNFRPETTFSKVAGRVRTADLQTRRLPLNPLLHGGLTIFILFENVTTFYTSSAYTVLSLHGFLSNTVYFTTIICPFSTKSLLRLHGFLHT